MSVLHISQAVFEQVETALTDNFNTDLAAACLAFGIEGQTFQVTWTPGKENGYFRAQLALDDLRKYLEAANWPIFCAYVRTVENSYEQIPSVFSGSVEFCLSAYLRFIGFDTPDMETLQNSVESTLVSILDGLTGSAILKKDPPLTIERETPVFDSDCWYTGLHLTATFEVTT